MFSIQSKITTQHRWWMFSCFEETFGGTTLLIVNFCTWIRVAVAIVNSTDLIGDIIFERVCILYCFS